MAYGFAMYEFKGKTLLFGLVLLMMTTAVEILMLPLFLEMQKLGLYGSWTRPGWTAARNTASFSG